MPTRLMPFHSHSLADPTTFGVYKIDWDAVRTLWEEGYEYGHNDGIAACDQSVCEWLEMLEEVCGPAEGRVIRWVRSMILAGRHLQSDDITPDERTVERAVVDYCRHDRLDRG